ncbi:transglutaminase [Polymorphobacter glacialis]|uniref:Transglutaminase n=1 Tax=Sandarakinorhabdus glacialis TaxID=1614636 RepID=A0A916ZQY8_9SPHN|nr:transglutaminase [Polymorphobacter glacialis]
MLIRAGCDIRFETYTSAPMMAMLSVHPSRNKDLRTVHRITAAPDVPMYDYLDAFGNTCTRVVVPPGGLTLSCDFVVEDSGLPDVQAHGAPQADVNDLPDDILMYLLGSRYCETDRLSDVAWSLFGNTEPGWARVQAIVDYAHRHIEFGYHHARPTKTAWDAYQEGTGVCRDFAHLAITLCRCMNIPARYCTGYLGDIGIPPVDAPMDFRPGSMSISADNGMCFDARHNRPRIGRILMARGRDATDTALTTTFGPSRLVRFDVHTDEVEAIA